MKTSRVMLLALSSLVAACLSAPAATIHVPGDQPTIQAGLDAALAGDTVLVACDTYYEHDIAMKSGVYLLSETMEADCVTIDAQELGRVFVCDGVDSLTTIGGFTITGGLAAGPQPDECGGGMYCFNCSPTLADCMFEGNHATRGGGLCCFGMSSPTLTGCVFEGNVAAEYGGGMYCYYYSSPTLTGCVFNENHVTFFRGGGACCAGYSSAMFVDCSFLLNFAYGAGGGLYCHASSPSFTDCTFDHNQVGWGGFGGGLTCRSSSPTLTGCTITGHDATNGGGMYCDDSTPTITGCSFEDNEALTGGGMYCFSSSPVVTGCLFLRNTSFDGGAVHCRSSSPALTGCTLVENGAGYSGCGGGVHSYLHSSPTLTNCIVAFGTDGGAVCCEFASTADLFCCDVYGNHDGDWVGCIAGQYGVKGNICEDPLFCGDLNPDEPYALHGSSPCAPAGNPECGLIGAFGVGCEVTAVEEASWGAIKAMFR